MIDRLTFFALVVKDMEKAVAFYTETWGMSINEQETVPQYYTQFDLDSVAGFALINGLDDSSEPYDIALKVGDADSVYNQLKAAGVELINAPRTDMFYAFIHRATAPHRSHEQTHDNLCRHRRSRLHRLTYRGAAAARRPSRAGSR